jgi:hypothetical protein
VADLEFGGLPAVERVVDQRNEAAAASAIVHQAEASGRDSERVANTARPGSFPMSLEILSATWPARSRQILNQMGGVGKPAFTAMCLGRAGAAGAANRHQQPGERVGLKATRRSASRGRTARRRQP